MARPAKRGDTWRTAGNQLDGGNQSWKTSSRWQVILARSRDRSDFRSRVKVVGDSLDRRSEGEGNRDDYRIFELPFAEMRTPPELETLA